MVIQNLEHSYVVVQACPGCGSARQFLCREEQQDGSWAEKKLGRIPLEEASGSLIRFLMDQIHRESFTDFEDYFTDDAFLYVVMRLEAGKPLGRKLEEEKCSLGERLELGRRMVERLVLLDPEPYFFLAAMSAERIRVDAALGVSFDYDISDLAAWEQAAFDAGARALGQVMETLFSAERKQRSMPELDAFCYGLAHGEWTDYLGILQAYQEVYARWIGSQETDLTPRTWEFRLWEAVKAAGRKLKKLAFAGILLLAFAYLVLSVWDFVRPPAQRENFKRIGTLQIEVETETAESEPVGQE